MAARPCFNNTYNLTVYTKMFRCSKIELNVTTCLPLQTPDEIDTIINICEGTDIMWMAGFWFSIVSGIVGNCLAIFTIASLPTSTGTFFVGLLAASDLTAICIRGVIHMLEKYHMLNRMATYWSLFPMMFDFSASYSNWLLVLICLERFLTVRFPLHKRYYFTLKHARVTALLLGLGLFTVYNIATWTLGYNDTKIFNIRNLLYAVLPLTFILIIIALISYQLRHVHVQRESLNGHVHSRVALSDDAQSARQPMTRANKTSLQDIARIENSITVMMLVAATCFSILTIPNCVILYTYRHSSSSWNTPVLRAQWYLFSKMSQILTCLNLSVNFLLYFLSAKKFRTQLYKVVSPRVWSLKKSSSFPVQQTNNNNSTTETIPLQNIVNGDYVTFHLAKDISPQRSDSESANNLHDYLRVGRLEVITSVSENSITDDAALHAHRESFDSHAVLLSEIRDDDKCAKV